MTLTTSERWCHEDLLHTIFDYFDFELCLGWEAAEGIQRRMTLISLATVCRDFHQPAMRVLWRVLDTIFPLLELFSSLVKVRTIVNLGDRKTENLYVSRPASTGGSFLNQLY